MEPDSRSNARPSRRLNPFAHVLEDNKGASDAGDVLNVPNLKLSTTAKRRAEVSSSNSDENQPPKSFQRLPPAPQPRRQLPRISDSGPVPSLPSTKDDAAMLRLIRRLRVDNEKLRAENSQLRRGEPVTVRGPVASPEFFTSLDDRRLSLSEQSRSARYSLGGRKWRDAESRQSLPERLSLGRDADARRRSMDVLVRRLSGPSPGLPTPPRASSLELEKTPRSCGPTRELSFVQGALLTLAGCGPQDFCGDADERSDVPRVAPKLLYQFPNAETGGEEQVWDGPTLKEFCMPGEDTTALCVPTKAVEELQQGRLLCLSFTGTDGEVFAYGLSLTMYVRAEELAQHWWTNNQLEAVCAKARLLSAAVMRIQRWWRLIPPSRRFRAGERIQRASSESVSREPKDNEDPYATPVKSVKHRVFSSVKSKFRSLGSIVELFPDVQTPSHFANGTPMPMATLGKSDNPQDRGADLTEVGSDEGDSDDSGFDHGFSTPLSLVPVDGGCSLVPVDETHVVMVPVSMVLISNKPNHPRLLELLMMMASNFRSDMSCSSLTDLLRDSQMELVDAEFGANSRVPPALDPSSPMTFADWAVSITFGLLPASVLLKAIVCLVQERSILVSCRVPGLASLVVSGLRELLEPYTWQAPFIPMAPRNVVEPLLSSPVPFLAGATLVLCRPQKEALRDQNVSFLELRLGHSSSSSRRNSIDATFDVTLDMNLPRGGGQPERTTTGVALPRLHELTRSLEHVLTPFLGIGAAWHLLANPQTCWLRRGLGLDLEVSLDGGKKLIRRWLRGLAQDVAYTGGWRNYGLYDTVSQQWMFQADRFCEEAMERHSLVCALCHSQLFHSYVDRMRREEQEVEQRKNQESIREA